MENNKNYNPKDAMFHGMNVEAFKNYLSPEKIARLKKKVTEPIAPLKTESHPKTEKTMFGDSNITEILGQVKKFKVTQKPANTSRTYQTPEIIYSKIKTADVIHSLLKVKENKRLKQTSLDTYQKQLIHFQKKFLFLPVNSEAILYFLEQFTGKTGRRRRNIYDALTMLYKHAVRRFGLLKNPMEEMERPMITRKPIKTLSLEQVKTFNKTPQALREKLTVDILLGHGWRQVEARMIQAEDVSKIENQMIVCHGKEREELAPLLPETILRLQELANGLDPEDFLFRAEQKRHGWRAPLKEDGMNKMIKRLMTRAGIQGFTGHDLRRTFATMVRSESGDEFLAMRLIRDKIPGVGERYIQFPKEELVRALEKYSPLRQIGPDSGEPALTGESSTPPPAIDDSPASKGGAGEKAPKIEAENFSGGDGGGSNSPSRRSCPGHPTSLVSYLISPDLLN